MLSMKIGQFPVETVLVEDRVEQSDRIVRRHGLFAHERHASLRLIDLHHDEPGDGGELV